MSTDQKETQRQQHSPRNDAPAVSGDAFVKHLEYASSVVDTWPKWKQQILGGTSTPPPSHQTPDAQGRQD